VNLKLSDFAKISTQASDAFAGTMLFLTYDGGHSLPESVGSFLSSHGDPRALNDPSITPEQRKEIIANRRQALENTMLDYGKLHESFHSPETSQAVSSARERAFDRVTNAFHRAWAESGRADQRFDIERISSKHAAKM